MEQIYKSPEIPTKYAVELHIFYPRFRKSPLYLLEDRVQIITSDHRILHSYNVWETIGIKSGSETVDEFNESAAISVYRCLNHEFGIPLGEANRNFNFMGGYLPEVRKRNNRNYVIAPIILTAKQCFFEKTRCGYSVIEAYDQSKQYGSEVSKFTYWKWVEMSADQCPTFQYL